MAIRPQANVDPITEFIAAPHLQKKAPGMKDDSGASGGSAGSGSGSGSATGTNGSGSGSGSGSEPDQDEGPTNGPVTSPDFSVAGISFDDVPMWAWVLIGVALWLLFFED